MASFTRPFRAQPQLKKESSLTSKIPLTMTDQQEERVVKRMGTFPRVSNPQLIQNKNKQQDTSPMRVSQDLPSKAQPQVQPRKETSSASYLSKNGSGTMNQDTSSYDMIKGNHWKARDKNEFSKRPPSNSNSEAQNSQANVNQNSQNNNQTAAAFKKVQQAQKYEQMAQNLNFESLIRNAQQRNNSDINQKMAVQYTFANKINTFEGDNDHVEEESEMSSLGSNSFEKHEKEQDYEVNDIESQEGSSSKNNRHSLTPESNVVLSGRSDNRIFSDLSQKVVNINNGVANNLPSMNPFNNGQQVPSNNKEKNGSSGRLEIKFNQEHSPNQTVNKQKYLSPVISNHQTCQNILGLNEVPQKELNVRQVTPFELMTSSYLNQKNQVISKYTELTPQAEQDDDIMNDSKSPPQKSQQDRCSDDTKQTYPDQQTEMDQPAPEEPSESRQTVGSTVNFLQNLNCDNNDNEQTLFDLKPKEDQSSRNPKSFRSGLQEEKFLTFDDFLKKGSAHATSVQHPIKEMDKKDIIQVAPVLQMDKEGLQKREREQEIKKKKEIELIRQRAIEKEKLRVNRLKSAVLIQSHVRGFLKRKQFRKQQENFRFCRKLRRMLSIAYGKKKTRLVQQVVSLFKEVGEQAKAEQEGLLQKYLDHCANTIQKVWRGYYMRRYIVPSTIAENKTTRALCSVLRGWKVRRILAGCREVLAIKRALSDIESMLRQTTNRSDPKLPNLMHERRKKVEELCCVVPNLLKKGRWVFSLQKRLQGSRLASRQTSLQKNTNSSSLPQTKGASVSRMRSFNDKNDLVSFNLKANSEYEPQQQPLQSTVMQSKAQPQQPQQQFSNREKASPIQCQKKNMYSIEASNIEWLNPVTEDSYKPSWRLSPCKDELESIPQTARTAVGQKLQVLDKQTTQVQMQPQVQKENKVEKGHFSNEMPTFDQENLEKPLPSSDHEAKPVKGVVSPDQFNLANDQSMDEPPKVQYNFEDMIEKALKDQQAEGGSSLQDSKSKSLAMKRSKTTRNDSDQENEDQKEEEQTAKTAKHSQKQNLKKRQKYDPRKAIEEAKAKEEQRPPAKSSFPEGAIPVKDRVRSTTGVPKTEKQDLEEEKQSPQQQQKRVAQVKRESKKPPLKQHMDFEEQEEPAELTSNLPSTNASSSGAKPFLKRKSKQVLQFQKCNWKVKSRINCWTGKEEKPTNNSQTRRQTSQMRSPRPQTSQMDTTPKGKQNTSHVNRQPKPQNTTSSHQAVTSTMKDQALRMQQEARANEQSLKQNHMLQQVQQMPIQGSLVDDTLDIISVPDENDQVMADSFYPSEIQDNQNSSEEYTGVFQEPLGVPHSYPGNPISYQAQQDYQSASFALSQLDAMGNENQEEVITLQLQELEKIIQVFHPKPQSFRESQIHDSERVTCIPHMSTDSMFFTCYSDDIYDTILEDLREHYIALCNE